MCVVCSNSLSYGLASACTVHFITGIRDSQQEPCRSYLVLSSTVEFQLLAVDFSNGVWVIASSSTNDKNKLLRYYQQLMLQTLQQNAKFSRFKTKKHD